MYRNKKRKAKSDRKIRENNCELREFTSNRFKCIYLKLERIKL